MVADGRRNHHHLPWADCGERLCQIGVQIYAEDGRWIQYDSRIDGRDELHSALVSEPRDPFGMDRSVAANSDQDQARSGVG